VDKQIEELLTELNSVRALLAQWVSAYEKYGIMATPPGNLMYSPDTVDKFLSTLGYSRRYLERVASSTKKITFEVFDGDKPAKYPDIKVHPSWSNNVFFSFVDAEAYALNWLGCYSPGKGIIQPNVPYDYDGCGDCVTIKTIQTE